MDKKSDDVNSSAANPEDVPESKQALMARVFRLLAEQQTESSAAAPKTAKDIKEAELRRYIYELLSELVKDPSAEKLTQDDTDALATELLRYMQALEPSPGLDLLLERRKQTDKASEEVLDKARRVRERLQSQAG